MSKMGKAESRERCGQNKRKQFCREATKRPEIEPAAPDPGKCPEQHILYWAGK